MEAADFGAMEQDYKMCENVHQSCMLAGGTLRLPRGISNRIKVTLRVV